MSFRFIVYNTIKVALKCLPKTCIPLKNLISVLYLK